MSAQPPGSVPPQDAASAYAELLDLNVRGLALNGSGNHAEAERLFRRAVGIAERVFGREHPHTLASLNNLALDYLDQGRYAEAEPLYLRVFEARERLQGREHPDTLFSLASLAVLYDRQARYAEAEPLGRRVLEARERLLGREHPDTLASLSNLAALYKAQGRLAEAGPLYVRVLAARERALGREHPSTLGSVSNLAALYEAQGRYAEAELLQRRALEASERTLGREHPRTLRSVNNLAVLYSNLGRYAEAEPLYLRVFEAHERLQGREAPETLVSLGNLAVLYDSEGRHAEAEPLHLRVLEARERLLGRDHPDTLISRNNLAALYKELSRYAEAEPLYRQVLEANERVLGREHPNTLIALNNLAALNAIQGRDAEAEPLFRRALEARQRVLGGEHRLTLTSAELLVRVNLRSGRPAPYTLAAARAMVAGLGVRQSTGNASQATLTQREREAASANARFALFGDAAWSSAPDDRQRAALLPEAFAALQRSVLGAADRSIARQAARRYAAGQSAALGALIGEREDLERRWSTLDERVIASYGGGGPAGAPAAMPQDLARVQARIEAIDTRLRGEAPDYFALIRPDPLDVLAARALLAPDEAILLVVPSWFGTHIVVVTSDDAHWRRSGWNAARARTAVQVLRWDAGASVDGTPEEMATLRARPQSGRPGFDRTTAHALYQELIAPGSNHLAGKRRVYVAAGGALAALPFQLLVSAPPAGTDNDPAALRATRWFGDDFALVHIPSLQSLALLRQRSGELPRDGFVGIGDPVLAGAGQARDRGAAQDPSATRQLFSGGRTRDGGGIANVSALRRLPRLPGTALELEAVRQTLGAPSTSLLLAERATEPNVRAADLSRSRILLFSTHGLTATESAMVGAGEAGLVLTPPAEGSDSDDGFLAASEVTTLSLNADWVILSACNTATGDGTTGAGLGGIARAFFYAGARNLLASHWPVSDAVAPILITRTMALERAGTPRAEAFRQAMREIRMDASRDTAEDSWAHPFYWAPFVLIGDGGR